MSIPADICSTAARAVRPICAKTCRPCSPNTNAKLYFYPFPFFARRDDFVVLSIPLVAAWANFAGAQLKTPAKVGRTPWSAAGPPASLPKFEPAPAPFAACRYAGQVGIGTVWVRRIVNPHEDSCVARRAA